MNDIPELILDAANWTEPDDVYDAFFAAVRAPSWHGRNLNALRDSIGTGEINGVELPYKIVVLNASTASADARRMLDHFAEVVEQLNNEGSPVEIKIAG